MTKKLPHIELTVNKHGQLVQTINKPIHDGNLPMTLEEFQVQANAALTQMIEDLDELGHMLGDGNMQNVEGENSADEEIDDEEDEADESTDGYDSEDGEESDNEDLNEQSGPKKKKHY